MLKCKLNKKEVAELPETTSTKGEPISEAEKFKAACSLNLLTVSVSQIIDYQDRNILDMEYDAILNNLNLQNINHSEHLLNVFKQLLDVITFYRIEAKEKEFIEQEYQQRMKSAIWSAVPNFALILSTPNVGAMAVALATQVGVGYMNYRKEKANAGLDKNKELWQLERSAIEQLNGLRRELFAAAWNIAKEYDFPDEWRLTENQISEYNMILMEPDPVKRFQSLDYIQKHFEAYPPFWYQFAHAAKDIYDNTNLLFGKEEKITNDQITEIKNEFKNNALKNYVKFSANNPDLLREDVIYASCALEQIPLLYSIDNKDKSNINKLLDDAKKHAGNNKDILQLIALNQLTLGDSNSAKSIFLHLINMNYNVPMNAQILSKIYAISKEETEYNVLRRNLSLTNEQVYMYPYDKELTYEDEIMDLTDKYYKFVPKFFNYYENQVYKLLIDLNNTNPFNDYARDTVEGRIKAVEGSFKSKHIWDSNLFLLSYTNLLNNILSVLNKSNLFEEKDLILTYRMLDRGLQCVKEKIDNVRSNNKNFQEDLGAQENFVQNLLSDFEAEKEGEKATSKWGISITLKTLFDKKRRDIIILDEKVKKYEANLSNEENFGINPLKVVEDGITCLYESFGLIYDCPQIQIESKDKGNLLSVGIPITYHDQIASFFEKTYKDELIKCNIKVISNTDSEMLPILQEAAPRNPMIPNKAIEIAENEYLLFYDFMLAYLKVNKLMNVCKVAQYKDVKLRHSTDSVIIYNLTKVRSLANNIVLGLVGIPAIGLVGYGAYRVADYAYDKLSEEDVRITGEKGQTIYNLIDTIKRLY